MVDPVLILKWMWSDLEKKQSEIYLGKDSELTIDWLKIKWEFTLNDSQIDSEKTQDRLRFDS